MGQGNVVMRVNFMVVDYAPSSRLPAFTIAAIEWLA